MGQAQRPRIKFDSLNSRLLYLVCEDSASCRQMIHTFQESKFEVQFVLNFNDLYGILESGRLGYVLLSRDLQEAFGEADLASFLQRRFQIPVLSFSLNPPPPGEKPGRTGDVVHLRGGMSPTEIIHDLICFEEDYEKGDVKVEGAPTTKYDELHIGLQKMIAEEPLKVAPGQELKVFGLRVKSGEDRYILLCGVPFPANPAKEEALKTNLTKFLQEQFSDSEISQSSVFDSLSVGEYHQLTLGARHRWQGHIGPVDCFLSLLAESAIHGKVTEHPQGVSIPLEGWLTQETLAFHIYHWMDRNQKMVRYAKAGQRFDASYFDRFTKRGVEYLLISQDDLDRYEIIRQLINSRAA